MKIKAADIAKELGISRSTVSLALNDRPGVSEETKREVFETKERLMNERAAALNSAISFSQTVADASAQPGLIKIIMFDRGMNVICNPDMNLWSTSLREFERVAKEKGFSISITYVTADPSGIQAVIDECNGPTVSGVVLFATEMMPNDYPLVQSIKKPLVVYDNDFSNLHHSVVADNDDITQQVVRLLASKGYRTLHYLAENFTIYNFEQRRIGYLAGIYTEKLVRSDCPIIETGGSIEEIEEFMTGWLSGNPLPDAFVMENYQVSVGTMRAMRRLGIRVPDDVGLIGIDEVSPYLTGDQKLDCVQIDHTDRIAIAVDTVVREIRDGQSEIKLKVATRSTIADGETLRQHAPEQINIMKGI